MIDLVGLERVVNTYNCGKRMVEGVYINRLLFVFGNCINVLSKCYLFKRKKFILIFLCIIFNLIIIIYGIKSI